MQTQIRAVLFDFDGLILDTESPEVTAWQEIYRTYGCEFPDWCNRQMIGQNTPESGELPFKVLEELSGKIIDRAEIQKRQEIRRLELIAELGPMPGVVHMIDQAKADGLRLAVVSSSSRKWVEGHLERLGLLHHFELVVCGGEEHASKPAPALYLAALDRLGISASEAIALEDSPNGIKAAKAAGIFCVAIPNRLTRHFPLDEADVQLDSLEDKSWEDLFEGSVTRA